MTVVVENKRLTAVFDECLPLVMCYTNIRYGSNISRAQVIITNDMRSAWIPTAIFFYTPRSLHTNISCTRRAAGAERCICRLGGHFLFVFIYAGPVKRVRKM